MEKQVTEAHRLAVLAIWNEETEEERAFMRAVAAGLADLEAGREVSLDDARTRLGLNWTMGDK